MSRDFSLLEQFGNARSQLRRLAQHVFDGHHSLDGEALVKKGQQFGIGEFGRHMGFIIRG
jgi:hypothetical protein